VPVLTGDADSVSRATTTVKVLASRYNSAAPSSTGSLWWPCRSLPPMIRRYRSGRKGSSHKRLHRCCRGVAGGAATPTYTALLVIPFSLFVHLAMSWAALGTVALAFRSTGTTGTSHEVYQGTLPEMASAPVSLKWSVRLTFTGPINAPANH